MRPAAAILAAALAGPAMAEPLDDDVAAFVESNILSIFYHELGHALIDVEDVPIFGQEEDAADVFSVVMTETIFEADRALELAYDYALGFDAEARARAETGEAHPWWDVHGPDEQRYYNTVCLFYGADPEARADFADDMGLPEDRAVYCPEEFEQAEAAWGAVLDDVMDRGPGDSLRFADGAAGMIGAILAEEIAALNEELQLSDDLEIRVEACGEANAFYDPAEIAIIFCEEYEADLIAAGEGTFR